MDTGELLIQAKKIEIGDDTCRVDNVDGYLNLVDLYCPTGASIQSLRIAGPTGATGPIGPTGPTGATGSQGTSGITYITYQTAEGETNTTSSSTKISYTTDSLTSGTYRISVTAEIKSLSSATNVYASMSVASTQYLFHSISTQGYYQLYSSFVDLSLSGVKTIELFFGRSGTSDTVYCRRARLEILRLS